MEKVVITIARQYGSGGRTVGEMLAKDLGIKYYDKEILKLASDESGINESLFEKADEKLKSTRLFKIAKKVYDGELISPESDDFTSNDNLFNYQARIIRKLAEEESCVIIGRCADYILRDYDYVLSVFVHAPEDFCITEAMKKLSLPLKEIDKFINKTDKRKAEYYKYYTGRDWTDARNYDLALNASKLGFERCMEAIKANIRVRFPDLKL
ncbi:MAG: cytidylate kinase-like family protein [Lachnospiraceae bacterium]|nr:cytidylate kinase-like family protein [Lachnospiraceae bacterium]